MDQSAAFIDLFRRAQRTLSHRASVVGVGFGFKEIGGVVTHRPALRVYVREKRSRRHVPVAECIPSTLLGIPTDVLPTLCGVSTSLVGGPELRPLLIGAAISNLKGVLTDGAPLGPGIGVGTLGFFAAENRASGRPTLVAVSNRHVLMAHGAALGDTIYQPVMSVENGKCIMRRDELTPFATICDEGLEGNYLYAYSGEVPGSYFVDCATSRLLPEHVSEVCQRFTAAGQTRRVRSIARVHPLDTLAGRELKVLAVAAMSGVVKGRIVDVAAPVQIDGGSRRDNNIVVQADAAAPAGADFLQDGDSGALLVDDQGRAIGMMWGRNRVNPRQAFASHIHPILHRLNVTLTTFNLVALRRGEFAATRRSAYGVAR